MQEVKSGLELFSINLPAARISVKANVFSEKSAKYAENIMRLTSRHGINKYALNRPERAHSPIMPGVAGMA